MWLIIGDHLYKYPVFPAQSHKFQQYVNGQTAGYHETDSSHVLQTQSPSLDLMCLCYTAVTATSRTQGGDRVSFKRLCY